MRSMDGSVGGDLGHVLRAAEVPTGEDRTATGHCGLCEASLRLRDGEGVVEVRLEDGDAPDAWLCPACYERVVEDMGIAPLRVFKTGPQRRVVLPVSPSTDVE